ncbi:MAG TPA: histidine triad nucleotide-binding protein [Candidatus Omnitrophota bacterium]|nr:histidine triad nucleotide-binding protein [Candidatus Omnitrophota bacterium]
MADDCIFCKIVKGDIPCSKVYEDEKVLAFDDIHPMAPVHVIVIPKKHIPTLLDCAGENKADLAAVMAAAQEAAKRKGVDQKGFRTVINCNDEGGQVIFHLHAHVLGGKKLADEMG